MADFRLQIYEGVGKVREVALSDGDRKTLGRTQSCDIMITGAGISRSHCVLICREGRLTIEDTSSERARTAINGTDVNGRARLMAGDELMLGEIVLVIQSGAEAAAPKRTEKPRKAPSDQPAPARASGADDGEGGDEDHEDAEDSGEELSARDRANEFRRRQKARQTTQMVVALAFVVLVLGGGWIVLEKVSFKRNNATPGGDEGGEVVRREGPARGAEGPRPSGGSSRGFGDADDAWINLLTQDVAGMPGRLTAFAQKFPEDRRSEDAESFAELLIRSGKARVDAVVASVVREADTIAQKQEYSRAIAMLELGLALAPQGENAATARRLAKAIRERAGEAFADVKAEALRSADRLGPGQGLILLAEARGRLSGLGLDQEIEDAIAELEQKAADREARRAGPQIDYSQDALTVENEAITAALRFDFDTALEKLDRLLVLSLRDNDRYRAHWTRSRVLDLKELYGLMQQAGGPSGDDRPNLTVAGDLKAYLVKAEPSGVTLSTLNGRGELKREWRQLTAYQVQELLTGFGRRELHLAQAKAFHAFRTGLEDLGTEILISFAKKKRFAGDVFSFYALVTGVSMPEGGFTVFERRLVDPSIKEQILADRIAAKQAAAELAAASKQEKRKQKLVAILNKVQGLMDRGFYLDGRRALAKLAKRHAEVEGVGDIAARRLASPVLRRRDMRLSKGVGRNGKPANRLDLYIMGDGFVLDDQKQKQFDRYADSAMKFCQLQDFFKEYDQFINYWAVNLISKEEGLTRDGTPKDTALGTQVNEGRHTVTDRGKIFSILEESFPGEHDRLAVCLGNDFATIATGGGGTVAICKTMLQATPHEVGHAYGGVGDEYDQEPGPNAGPPMPYSGPARRVAPNVVAGSDRQDLLAKVPWKDWLDPTGKKNWTGKPIDLFEGANRQPKGYWRPQRACVMRDVGSPFCAVCMSLMVQRLYRYVRPIDEVWPKDKVITANSNKTITLRALVMKPKNHDLFCHWTSKAVESQEIVSEGETKVRENKKKPTNISGRLQVIEGNYVHYIKVKPRELDPGRYEFSAKVWDPTPWLLDKDRDRVATQTHKWTIVIPPRD